MKKPVLRWAKASGIKVLKPMGKRTTVLHFRDIGCSASDVGG